MKNYEFMVSDSNGHLFGNVDSDSILGAIEKILNQLSTCGKLKDVDHWTSEDGKRYYFSMIHIDRPDWKGNCVIYSKEELS